MKEADTQNPITQRYEFRIESLQDTEALMALFADFLARDSVVNDDVHLRRVGLMGNHNNGKSKFANGIQNALGADDVTEEIAESDRHKQSVRFSEKIGVIRHYDAGLRGDFRLKSAADPDFWDKYECGLDLCENPAWEKEGDFDFLFDIEKVDRRDRSESAPRDVTIYVDPVYLKNENFLNFLQSAQACFSSPESDVLSEAPASYDM